MIRHFIPGAVCCLALTLSGCAIGGGADQSTAGGSRLAPTFAPEHGKHGVRARRALAPPTSRPAAAASPRATGAAGGTAGHHGGRPTGQPSPTPAPAGNDPAVPATASLRDGTGDVSGVGAPAYADLTGAIVTRSGDGYRVRIEVAGPLPARQGDDRTMNIACFVDTDGDGQVDYEMWAALSDDGWSTSYRYPDGARFGSSSGVSVAVSGATLTLGFARSAVGGASSFRWATGAEYGTVEQVASGTTAQDLAPDTGAAPFPGP